MILIRKDCLVKTALPRFIYSVLVKRLYSCKTKIGPPWDVLFFGTDNFALYSLKSLWAKLNTGTILSNLAVVSKKGCPVRKFADSECLTVYDWPLEVESIQSKYHIGMVVSFGKLIPEDVIKSFPLGCINVHASLLPRWRGAAPIIHAISNGDTETGITIMRIRPHKFDTGEIIRQYRLSIGPNETSKDVENKLGVCGSNLLMECLRDMPRCLDMGVSQPEKGITYAPKVNSTMAHVSWTKMTALNVYNLHRALYHLYPLTTRWNGQPVKLHQISLDKIFSDSHINKDLSPPLEEQSKLSALDFLKATPSTVSPSKVNKSKDSVKNCGNVQFEKPIKQLKVVCADGNYVTIKKISIGGKTMSATDFYNGFMTRIAENERKFSA